MIYTKGVYGLATIYNRILSNEHSLKMYAEDKDFIRFDITEYDQEEDKNVVVCSTSIPIQRFEGLIDDMINLYNETN